MIGIALIFFFGYRYIFGISALSENQTGMLACLTFLEVGITMVATGIFYKGGKK